MITIIGSGRVGSALGFLIATTSIDDLILINKTKNEAVGRALDITNTIPPDSSISVTGTDDFEAMRGSKIIVIAASRADIANERIEVLFENVALTKEISPYLKKYADDAKIVVVTNPLDVITYHILKETEFPRQQIFGMGSRLDSSRFRYLLSLKIGTDQSKIKAMVIGEHGPSMVPLFSTAKYNENPVSDFLDDKQVRNIKIELKEYGSRLRFLKTVSTFGAARNIYDIVKAIINDEKVMIPVSVLLEGEYGLSDVCLGVPTTIGKSGPTIQEIYMVKAEADLLLESANVVKNNIKKIQTMELA